MRNFARCCDTEGAIADAFRQFVHRALAVYQCPQNLHTGCVGQHAEHLDDEVDLIIGKLTATNTTICVHT